MSFCTHHFPTSKHPMPHTVTMPIFVSPWVSLTLLYPRCGCCFGFFNRSDSGICQSVVNKTFMSQLLSKFSGLNIKVDILHDIIGSVGVQSFKAGIHIVPHVVTDKEFLHLLASQVLGVFVGFHTINGKLSLPAHTLFYTTKPRKSILGCVFHREPFLILICKNGTDCSAPSHELFRFKGANLLQISNPHLHDTDSKLSGRIYSRIGEIFCIKRALPPYCVLNSAPSFFPSFFIT